MSENLTVRRDNNDFSFVELERLADIDATIDMSLNRDEDGEVVSLSVVKGGGKGAFELVYTPAELYTVRTPSDDAISEIGKIAVVLNAIVIDDYGDIWDPEHMNSTSAHGEGSGSTAVKILFAIGILLSLFWWQSQ